MPGIEMSMTTTSGFNSSARCTARRAVARLGDDVHVGLAVDQQLEPVPHGDVIVGQKNPKRRRRVTP